MACMVDKVVVHNMADNMAARCMAEGNMAAHMAEGNNMAAHMGMVDMAGRHLRSLALVLAKLTQKPEQLPKWR